MTPRILCGDLGFTQSHFPPRTNRQAERVRGKRIKPSLAVAAFFCGKSHVAKPDQAPLGLADSPSLPLKKLPMNRPIQLAA